MTIKTKANGGMNDQNREAKLRLYVYLLCSDITKLQDSIIYNCTQKYIIPMENKTLFTEQMPSKTQQL